MRAFRSACLLLLLPLCAVLCSESALSWASAKDHSDHQEEGQIGVSASYEIHGDTTSVTINWEGCSEEDMVVVSLDTVGPRNRPGFPLVRDAKELTGLVFLRSAAGTGSATFSYNRREFVERTGDPQQALSVHLTSRIRLVHLAGEDSGKGAWYVTGSSILTSAECMDYFRILCSDLFLVWRRDFSPVWACSHCK